MRVNDIGVISDKSGQLRCHLGEESKSLALVAKAVKRLAVEIIFIIEDKERNLGSYICIPTIEAIRRIYKRLFIKNSFNVLFLSVDERARKSINLFLKFSFSSI